MFQYGQPDSKSPGILVEVFVILNEVKDLIERYRVQRSNGETLPSRQEGDYVSIDLPPVGTHAVVVLE